MHLILFQLSVLPLTMCRHLISNLWNTYIGKIIPFYDMTKYHIAIGYTLMVLLFATIVVFIMFFGTLCKSGAQPFCAKFKSEIIITGYVIFIVSGESFKFFIHNIPTPHNLRRCRCIYAYRDL